MTAIEQDLRHDITRTPHKVSQRGRPRRLALLILCFGMALTVLSGLLPTASDVEDLPAIGAIAEHIGVQEADAAARWCGWATCTDYSSRGEVRAAANQIRAVEARVGNIWHVACGGISVAAGAVGAAITGPLGLAVGAVAWIGCEALRWKYGSITDTIKAAAANGQCFAVSFARYGSNNLAFATRWWRYGCNWG